jgi:hypothetical protein
MGRIIPADLHPDSHPRRKGAAGGITFDVRRSVFVFLRGKGEQHGVGHNQRGRRRGNLRCLTSRRCGTDLLFDPEHDEWQRGKSCLASAHGTRLAIEISRVMETHPQKAGWQVKGRPALFSAYTGPRHSRGTDHSRRQAIRLPSVGVALVAAGGIYIRRFLRWSGGMRLASIRDR